MDYKYTKIKLFKLGHHSSYLTVRSPLINSFVRNEIINFCFSCFSCLNKMKNFLFGVFLGVGDALGRDGGIDDDVLFVRKMGIQIKKLKKKKLG